MSWAKIASDQIRAQWIPHPKFRQAESEALAALLTADPGEVVCIVGPSRVGKSALVERMKRSLIGESPVDGSMPVVSIVMENDSMNGTLSSKSFTVSALLAVNHPMFGTDGPDDLWGIERMRKVERTPEGVLRTAFENALRHRGTQYVVIDEAHHLRYARGGKEAAVALLDSLKCLAARTRVVPILVGAYPLLELLLSLPHLLGRKLQIHFARYRDDIEADVLAFDRILLEYSASLRFCRAQSLRDWNDYLHEGSLGCIGLLRGWIRDALNKAWLLNASELTRRCQRRPHEIWQTTIRKSVHKSAAKRKDRSLRTPDGLSLMEGEIRMASSYLFSLLLRGVGTADVESLSSYLCRLSAAHSSSVKDVIEHAFLWRRRTTRPDIAMPFVTRSPESLAYYVRPNGMTRLLVEALMAATQRSDLRCGTFLALELTVSRCMGTFVRAVRWCPQCMREFVEVDDEGYMKLQWQLCDVERCSLHGVMLLDKCPHCERHQNGCARRERVTHCVFCKRQLAPVTVEALGPGSWKVESADLIELVEEIASKPTLVYPKEGPRAVLTELFDRVWQREEERRLWKMVPRDEVLSIIDGTTPISLKTARRLAFQLGLRLADMLAGTFAQTTDILDDVWTAKLPATMRPKRRAARRDRMRLMVALEDAVRRSRRGNPDALRHVARSLGVSTGCLTYHFPELARELLALHACWRRAEKERKRLQARAAVLRQLALSEPDWPHSHKAMLRVLRATTKLPKEVLRAEIARCI